jgi:Uma2 family endonuclease
MSPMDVTLDHPRRHAITVEEYLRMGEAQVFAHDARLELMEGALVEMPPIGSPHAAVVNTLAALLAKAASASRAIVSVQNPLVLNERSAPQPDVMLLRPRTDRYYHSHPTAADAFLVVEVADTTLRYDLDVKRPLYAQTGIAQLWVIDIERRILHSHLEPVQRWYKVHRTFERDEKATVAALDELAIPVSSLFPT